MLRILVIEPHGDDALCSCSSVLRSKDFQIDIITFSERDSTNLYTLYPSILNSEFAGYKDLNYYERPKVSTGDIHRRFNEGQNVYSYYNSKVVDIFNDDYRRAVVEVSDYLHDVLHSGDYDNYDFILAPVGLSHPYHIAVSEGVEHSLLNSQLTYPETPIPILIYYVDKPYHQTRYVKEMCSSFINNNELNSLESPKVDKEELSYKTFKEIYPTELGMLRFSKDILLSETDKFLYSYIFTVDLWKLDKFKGGLM